MADTAADVAAIADALGVDRFALWGTSGGSPHALACAALLTDDRLIAAAVLASYAPYDAPGLDFFAGMSEGGSQMLKLATAGREALQQVLSQLAEAVSVGTPEQWVEQMSPMVSPPDQAVFDAELAAAILADWREGLTPGVEGWVDDYLALLALGGSIWQGSGCRSGCGSARRTGRCRPLTGAGWPTPSPAPSWSCSRMRATSR